ncbi:hypothetical protein ACFS5M_14120 [Lacinutrix iliipiscaria]|uniref:Uncharacterized protein n=1 Tax=Lacinutrix iliipiscaria TaxID=1230532 RepID=A0ABW5WUD4_9FLAO
MSKENSNTEKQPKNTLQLANTLLTWGDTVYQWEPKKIKDSLNEMKSAYLDSSLADNKQDRRDTLFHHSLLERLLDELITFKPEHFEDLPTLKIQEPCTETA